MKKQLLTLLMLVSVILCKHQALHSQVSNDEIYLEYGITTWSAIVFENDDPTEPVDSEPVIISNLITSGDLEWYFICNPMESGVGGGLEEPGFNSEYEIGPVPFGTAANFFLFAWERDTGVNSDLCYYEEEFDDNYGSDYPLHITPNTTITNNRAPGEWHDSFVEEGENVLLLEGGLGVYGVKPCIYWSYAHGNNINDPLQFGTLSNSDEVTHQNFTSAAPSGTIGAHDDYTNTGGEYDSRDVFYSFSLSEDAVVIISTQNSDFDTYIELYDSNNDIIQVNDDVQQGITTSLIQRTLCAGDYKILVEGYNSASGASSLRISTSELVPLTASASTNNATCPNAENGVAMGSSNYPVSFEWFDSNNISLGSGEFQENLGAGNYTLTVTDQCGNTQDDQFTVSATPDTTPPTCLDFSTSLQIEPGSTLSAEEIADELMNAFTDNCYDSELNIDTNGIEFSANDLGQQTIQVTATDGAGLSNTCPVTVEVVLGLNDLDQITNLNLYPVPASDILHVELSNLSNEALNFQVMDLTGRVVLQPAVASQTQGTIDLNISSLSQGIYILKLSNKSKSIEQKFTKI